MAPRCAWRHHECSGGWQINDQRHRYDRAKAHDALLSTLSYRIAHNLHLPIPPCPSAHAIPPSSLSFSSLTTGEPGSTQNIERTGVPPFAILPLPTFTHPSGEPIALITIREVTRDDHGSLDGLKEWVGWGMEMTRRVLRDQASGGWPGDADASSANRPDAGTEDSRVWQGKKELPGRHDAQRLTYVGGGTGCVLVIDAAGAGYRNLVSSSLSFLILINGALFSPSLLYSCPCTPTLQPRTLLGDFPLSPFREDQPWLTRPGSRAPPHPLIPRPHALSLPLHLDLHYQFRLGTAVHVGRRSADAAKERCGQDSVFG